MLTLLSHHQNQLPAGEVWLVGAGPGDPELISVRGLRLIRQADVLVHDRLVAQELIEERRTDALCIDVGKRPGHHPVPQQEIEELLIRYAQQGKSVVRLKGGDPFIFGRGGEEMLTLRAAGITTHVVPGITAASACAAAAGFPLTQRNTANSVCLTTAHHCGDNDNNNWSSLAGDKNRTLVFYMGLSALAGIRSKLMLHGMSSATPCALVENGSTLQQRTVYCTLHEIADKAVQHHLKTPCLLVVGDVVALAEQYREQRGQPTNGKPATKAAAGACLAVGLLLSSPALADDNPARSFADALAQGDSSVSLRLRHERVQDETVAKDAIAHTLRTRLTYASASWAGLDATLELDHVSAFPDARYNSTRNRQYFYATIADPKGTDLNLAALRYRQGAGSATVGRQRLNRGNQRFIGSVGWRQNEQTFDALNLTWQAAPNIQLSYAWVDNTRRIFGPDRGTPPAKLDSNHHLLDAGFVISDAINISAYHYALDFEQAPALSSATTGIMASGTRAAENASIDYRVELARQDDYGSNPVDYDAWYHMLSAGLTIRGVRLGLAHETLGADSQSNAAVQTPLATLHAFQGWADQFLTTPAVGIRDNSVTLSGSLANISLMAAWHDYQADSNDMLLGREWNLQARRVVAKRYTFTLKYADYQAAQFGADTGKLWLMVEAGF